MAIFANINIDIISIFSSQRYRYDIDVSDPLKTAYFQFFMKYTVTYVPNYQAFITRRHRENDVRISLVESVPCSILRLLWVSGYFLAVQSNHIVFWLRCGEPSARGTQIHCHEAVETKCWALRRYHMVSHIRIPKNFFIFILFI